jgi:hypothetical protein
MDAHARVKTDSINSLTINPAAV